jgi:hypothetical protein
MQKYPVYNLSKTKLYYTEFVDVVNSRRGTKTTIYSISIDSISKAVVGWKRQGKANNDCNRLKIPQIHIYSFCFVFVIIISFKSFSIEVNKRILRSSFDLILIPINENDDTIVQIEIDFISH